MPRRRSRRVDASRTASSPALGACGGRSAHFGLKVHVLALLVMDGVSGMAMTLLALHCEKPRDGQNRANDQLCDMRPVWLARFLCLYIIDSETLCCSACQQ